MSITQQLIKILNQDIKNRGLDEDYNKDKGYELALEYLEEVSEYYQEKLDDPEL